MSRLYPHFAIKLVLPVCQMMMISATCDPDNLARTAYDSPSHALTFCQSQRHVQEHNKRRCQSEWEDYRR